MEKKREDETGVKIRCIPIRFVDAYPPNIEYTDLLTYPNSLRLYKACSGCMSPALVVLAHSAPSLLVGCIGITTLSAVSHIS